MPGAARRGSSTRRGRFRRRGRQQEGFDLLRNGRGNGFSEEQFTESLHDRRDVFRFRGINQLAHIEHLVRTGRVRAFLRQHVRLRFGRRQGQADLRPSPRAPAIPVAQCRIFGEVVSRAEVSRC